MFKNYQFTYSVVEMRSGGVWRCVRETASHDEARLIARLLALQYPLSAVRVRNVSYGA